MKTGLPGDLEFSAEFSFGAMIRHAVGQRVSNGKEFSRCSGGTEGTKFCENQIDILASILILASSCSVCVRLACNAQPSIGVSGLCRSELNVVCPEESDRSETAKGKND